MPVKVHYFNRLVVVVVVGFVWLGAVRATATTTEAEHDVEPCGTLSRTRSDQLVEQIRLQHLVAATTTSRQGEVHHEDGRTLLYPYAYEDLCDQCIEIDVHFHLVLADVGFGPFIPHPLSSSSSLVLDESLAEELSSTDFSSQQDIFRMIESNMNILNESFQGTPFRFRLVPENTKTATNTQWSNYARDMFAEMATALGSNNVRIMDVYLVFRIQSTDSDTGGAKGVAYLPSASGDDIPYGIWLRYDVLPSGGYPRGSMGYTFVHEVGHWLGLDHTFNKQVEEDDLCNPGDANDYVDDTPIQAGPSTDFVDNCVLYVNGDREPLDTCPDLPGVDAQFNFMNYVDSDICWSTNGDFTPNQIERMYLHWLLFRDMVTVCEDPDDMEIEIAIVWDRDHASDNWIRLIEQESGLVVFDSNRDHPEGIASDFQTSLVLDLCVPRTSTYVLKVYDKFGDGFFDGKMEVFRDRVLLETLEGSVPRFVEVVIPALDGPTAAPTATPTLTPTNIPTTIAPTTELPVTSPPSDILTDKQPDMTPSPSSQVSAEDTPSGASSMTGFWTLGTFSLWIVAVHFFV